MTLLNLTESFGKAEWKTAIEERRRGTVFVPYGYVLSRPEDIRQMLAPVLTIETAFMDFPMQGIRYFFVHPNIPAQDRNVSMGFDIEEVEGFGKEGWGKIFKMKPLVVGG